ncbi:hypothetical protein Goarm_003269, partial [Gossypium armourianum]|nr:hypothetical protein [Gossypium armourianum]
MIVVEDVVWNSYIIMRIISCLYYLVLTKLISNVDSFGKDAQTAADIVEEIDAEDVATANNLEEGNNYHRCEGDAYWMRWMSRLHN